MAIHIVTDSSADLPQQIIEKYGISVVPLSLEFAGEVFKDGELEGKVFFDKMDIAKDLPKTGAPSPRDFADIFNQVPQDDQIICITVSSKLSGSFQSAKIGAELARRKVYFVDSKAATMGLGIITVYAAELAKIDKGIQGILEEVQRRVENLRMLVFLDTAKNIVKSGRLGKVAGSLINMLNLKVLLTNDDGQIKFLAKMRGKKRVFNKFITILEEYGQKLEGQIIGISHADNLSDAEKLKQLILEKFRPREVILGYMGSCIGTHAGRGGLTISF